MIPRGAWPLEPATRRAIAETLADGRHEWQRAEDVADCLRVAARFSAAIVSVIFQSAWRETVTAMSSPLPLRWLIVAGALSMALPTISLWRGGLHLQRWPQPDECLVAFLATMPISVYLSALPGRRGDRLPVAGMTVVITLMLVLTLLLALPIAQAGFFAQVTGGQLYLPVPGTIQLGFGLPCLILCVCELLVLERARAHRRRMFLSLLVPLLPILALTLKSAMPSSAIASSTGVAFAIFLLTAALPLAGMWAVLVRHSADEGARL